MLFDPSKQPLPGLRVEGVLSRRPRHSPAEQRVHVFERPALCLWVEYPDYGHADQVDGHEEEVDLGADAMDADGPDVGDGDGGDGAPGGGEAEAAGADGGWEDLVMGSMLGWGLSWDGWAVPLTRIPMPLSRSPC